MPPCRSDRLTRSWPKFNDSTAEVLYQRILAPLYSALHSIYILQSTEKQDHGKNEEKYANRRKKLLEAYNKGMRKKKILERTQQINSNSKSQSNHDNLPEFTPPPIEGFDPSNPSNNSHSNESNTATNDKQNDATHQASSTGSSSINEAAPSISNPMMNANPLLNPLYANSLLFNQYGPPSAVAASLYTDSLGAKSNRNQANPLRPTHPSIPQLSPYHQQRSLHPNRNANGRRPERQRRRFTDNPRDAFDPMNPANPTYNFLLSKQKGNQINPPPLSNMNPYQQQIPVPTQHVPHTQQPISTQPVSQPEPVVAPKKKDEDITKMAPVERPIEVIMDPKLKALMPSSMRFKRKYAKPKAARPAKKRKLDIAPDVDGNKDGKVPQKKTDRNSKTSYNAVNADAAYDKFMDEISGLI